jgi:hypothetical protein
MVKRKHFFFLSSEIALKEKPLFSWRRLRRAANEGFSKSSVKGFYETQMTEAVLLAGDMLVGPARWDQHFRRAAASTNSLSSTATLHLRLNKIISSRPLTILPSVF